MAARTSAPQATNTATARLTGGVLALARRHWPGIALILLLTAAVAGPRWWLLSTSPPEGQRIQVAPWAASDMGYDLALFSPYIRDAFDGDTTLHAAFNLGDRDLSTPPGSLWLAAIGAVGRITGDPFSGLALVTTLTAAAALLLLYVLALALTGSRLAAAAALPLAALFVGVIVQAGGILPLRHGHVLRAVLSADGGRELHAWFRFLPPSVPLPVFLACALAVPRAAETGRPAWMIAATLALALLIYTYLFYWSAMAVALLLWCAWLWYRRDFTMLRRVLIIGVAASLVASPEIAGRVKDAFTLPADAAHRFGRGARGIDTGQLSGVLQRFAISVPFLWALLRGPERNRLYALLLVVPLGLDLTTGLVPQPEHYVTQVWHVFALPALIAGSAELWSMAPGMWRRPAAVAIGALAAAGVVYVAAMQVHATKHTQAQYSMPADDAAAFDWMDAHLHGDDVVVSPSVNTNMLLVALTPASRYIDDGFFSRLSDDEIIDRFLRAQAAFGYSADDVFARLDPANGYPTSDQGIAGADLERHFEESSAYFLFNWEITHPDLIADRLPAWRQRYASLLAQRDVLSAHNAGYLFCGHRERFWAAAAPTPGTYVRLSFRQGDAAIYQIVDASAQGAQEFEGCR